MNLPEPDPTPPDIPAEHVDPEKHHTLDEFTSDR